jgi:Protein of unknown function (DUF1549)/Protein of unknown function (DUF1553)
VSTRSPDPARSSPALILLALIWLAPRPAKADTPTARIEPAIIRLEGAGARQQVAVTVEDADGSVRDATANASYRFEPQGIAEVSKGGLVVARSDGRATLIVQVDGRSATVPVEVARADWSRPSSYRLEVAALLSKAGCNSGPCHGNINGKGGFKLSLRGDDPTFDLASMTRDTFGRRVDLASPAQSLILLKPTGLVPHEGGRRFAGDSPESTALLRWIASGGRDDLATAPRLLRLDVFPAHRIAAAPSLGQQLVVTATFADGSTRDVTRQASYDLDDPTKVSVTTDGRVEAKRPVETTIAVRYLGGRGVSRLAFLPDRAGFVWREPKANNLVDLAVFAKLKAHKIHPSEPTTDATFLRRAYLDAIGVLPTPAEAREFLADTDPARRSKLVDRLLLRPEFADFWALKWADLLRNEEKAMGPKGVWVFQRWLRDQIAADVPLDLFARRLVASTGSTYRNPPASFYRTNRDPSSATEAFSQVFLGLRLQCARCHNHPYDSWTQADYYSLSAYFTNVRRKQIDNRRSDDLDSHEIKGDEVIYLEGKPGAIHPRSGERLDPKPPNGPKPKLGDGLDARDDLADWLTVGNRQFARNMANRVWFHLMGRGVVEPVDDFRDSNPPSNPELLDTLTTELIAGGYRLRPLVALIMNSGAYGLEARPDETADDDEANFAHASVRLLPAEVLIDAICQVLERPEPYDQSPHGVRSVQMPGAHPGGSFLRTFGKPDRLLTCECERSESTTLAQAFQLINGESIRSKLTNEDNRIGRLLRSGANDSSILDELALAALGHPFDATRSARFLEHVARAPDRRKAWEDVAWAILNSKEFLLRH